MKNRIFIEKGDSVSIVGLEINGAPKKFLKVLEPQQGSTFLGNPSTGKFQIIDVPGEQEPVVLLESTASHKIELMITDDLTAVDEFGNIYFSVRNETY